jgi:hypothetical protein
MRAFSLKAVAVTTVAASALVAGAATAQAAEQTHVSATSKRGQSVSVALPKFKGGSVSVTVDATGTSTAKHTWTLYVNGKKVTAKSYTDRGKAETWVVKSVPSGTVKVAAPASKSQITTVSLNATSSKR